MSTVRAIADQVRNALDYVRDAELAHFTTEISMNSTSVAWHPLDRKGGFIESFEHPTIDQYVTWLVNGDYSALFFDGSLIQITYGVTGGEVSRHRLAYFPCPYVLDRELLGQGMSVADAVELCRNSDAVLRSPIRFDFDSQSAAPGHPASHVTINGVDCRIACIAPLHVMRFLDFVFRHFYAQLHSAHRSFFGSSHSEHIGPPSLGHDDRHQVHFAWDVYATATGGMLGR
ncbi:MAG: DUF2290 domain-containing protein [Acidimicrobiaceae bacterium]|nr:DUF2290 domain-containing protein [Acidimicrobiaceae bacterium]